LVAPAAVGDAVVAAYAALDCGTLAVLSPMRALASASPYWGCGTRTVPNKCAAAAAADSYIKSNRNNQVELVPKDRTELYDTDIHPHGAIGPTYQYNIITHYYCYRCRCAC
jgi:hypothetical protein